MRDTKVIHIVIYEAVALVCMPDIVVVVFLHFLSALLGQIMHQLCLLNMIGGCLYDGLLFSTFACKKGLYNVACFLLLCNSYPVVLVHLLWIHLFFITEFIDRTTIRCVLLFTVAKGIRENSAFDTRVIVWRSNQLILPDFTKLLP
jgi:hypothetical protein